jgi:hypothetical protein
MRKIPGITANFKYGCNSDYGILKSIILGTPKYFEWTDAGAMSRRYI